MNVSEEPVPNSREHSRESRVGSSSPSSSSSPSASGTRQDQSTSGTDQQPQGIASENTPINSGSAHRDYQATGSMRNRASGPSNGQDQGKNPPQEQNGDGVAGDGENHHRPWYIRMANQYGSLELENKGSVARDHLALERTFLAWLRTSLAFASIGIAVTQLFRLSHSSNDQDAKQLNAELFNEPSFGITENSGRLRSLGKPLGTTFIAVAVVVLLVGFHRFVESQYWILRGKFPASRGSVALIAFITVALIIAALVVIVAVAPGVVEA